MQEQMGSVSREVETLKKKLEENARNQKQCIRNGEVLDGLINRQCS